MGIWQRISVDGNDFHLLISFFFSLNKNRIGILLRVAIIRSMDMDGNRIKDGVRIDLVIRLSMG